MTIIVTGAAGHVGRLVAGRLLQQLPADQVVLVTRRPETLSGYAARGAQVRYGDFDDPASLRDAFVGGGRMLLVSTDAVGRRVRQHRRAIDAAMAAGIGHVVFTSIVNPVTGSPLGPIVWEQGRTEAILRSSGLTWTILRFGSYAELQLPPAAVAVRNRRVYTNGGDGRIVPVSRRDCAEAAAAVLTTDGHVGRTYDITGPEALTPSGLAGVYAGVSGQSVDVVDLSDQMLTLLLVRIGTPPAIASHITAFGRAVRQGHFDVVDPACERLTGHPPATLSDVLVAHRADLLAAR